MNRCLALRLCPRRVDFGVCPKVLLAALRRFPCLLLVLTAACLLPKDVLGRGLPVTEGILNFGKVNDGLYRGAQPDGDGLEHLKKLGVKLIINLREPGDVWKEESAAALACGIVYTNFPMGGFARPKDDVVRQILALLGSSTGPVFVHCQHGCDRTGTIVACYRIQHDHWSCDDALREAKQYGISRWEYLMRRYVREFARSLVPTSSKPDTRQARAN